MVLCVNGSSPNQIAYPWPVWLIMEQVAMAALDVKELYLALSLIKEIRGKFPQSQRTLRLTVRPLLPCTNPVSYY